MKIDEETAENEFERFCELMDIETDLDKEDRADFMAQKSTLVKAIRRGHAVIDDDGLVSYTTWKSGEPQTFKFNEITGAVLISMEKSKGGGNARVFRGMAEITETNDKVFSNLKRSDLAVCMSVYLLLMG